MAALSIPAARVHERRGGGELDEAQPLEDRAAVVRGVDLEVAVAARRREGGAVRDEGAEDAPASPGGQGAGAPEAGEVGFGRKLDAAGGDRRLPGDGDHGGDRAGPLRDAS